MTLYGILIAYVFIGCVYWLWMFVGTVRVVRAVPLLAQSDPPPPQTWPKLSVVIPACNEAAALESALGSVLEQDYPELEIILIDDRSTDGTAAIVDRMAAADPRILRYHVEQLPEGWLGKVHALDLGAAKAGGSWLLFTDADVHMAPGALRRAIAYAAHHSIDHLAAVPDLWPSSLLVDANMALFCRTFAVAMRLWAVADPKSDAFDRRRGLQSRPPRRAAAYGRIFLAADGSGRRRGPGHDAQAVRGPCVPGQRPWLAWAALVSDFAGNGPRRGKGLRLGRPLQPGPRCCSASCSWPWNGRRWWPWPAGRFPTGQVDPRAALVGHGHACSRGRQFPDSRPLVEKPFAARGCFFRLRRSLRPASCCGAVGSDIVAAGSCGAARSIARTNCSPAGV